MLPWRAINIEVTLPKCRISLRSRFFNHACLRVPISRFKEIEMKLLLSCKEDLLRFKEEEEESKENMEEAISKEHK